MSIKYYPLKEGAVTIIAGFKCYEGIVLCADTQETLEVSKRSVPKLQFEPSGGPHEGEGLAAAFCGAGRNGAFIDKLVNNAWRDGQQGMDINQVCEKIEESIKSTYREFSQIFQLGYCPEADLIYGVKMNNICRLFSASGPIVNEKLDYDSFGSGQYMADFLVRRMYAHHLNLRQCAILAAYILFQSKEHVVGCGGESHIAVLREDGVSGMADRRNIEAWTDLLRLSDEQLGKMSIDAADMEISSEQFMERNRSLIEAIDMLRNARAGELQHDKRSRELFAGSPHQQTDFFALPLPSNSATPTQN